MKRESLESKHTIIRLISETEDIASFNSVAHLQILFSSRLIHRFEQRLVSLQKKRLLWGALHPSFGMEVSASAALHALGKQSRINSTHRGHHHVLAKGLFSLMPESWNPVLEQIESHSYEPLVEYIRTTCAEILGLKNGLCKGRGGSMHLYDASVGVHGTNAIVGGALPAAVGLAFGAVHNTTNEVVMTFFGDGASNQGTFHESCNLASIYSLPLIFYLENNQYAVGTSARSVCSGEGLAYRGIGYGLRVFQVSADDPLAVHQAVTEAKNKALQGEGPALIEAIGYRPIHHDSPLPGSAYGYRSKNEEAFWAGKSGYDNYPKLLLQHGQVTATQLHHLDETIEAILNKAMAPLIGGAEAYIDDVSWPTPLEETRTAFSRNSEDRFEQSLHVGVRSDVVPEVEHSSLEEAWSTSIKNEELTYVDAIAYATGQWMKQDDSVYVWGEDVANFKQGPYGATKGLMKEFPERVLNMPISESAFVGMALGASMMGLKPIVEIMFPDFILVAADQFFNQIAKARFMYGGNVHTPIIVRTRISTGTGMGPQHSMDPVGLFSLFNGWRIIAPSDAVEYIGLFNTAKKSTDPVLILEHHLLYGISSVVPDNKEYGIPFGSARIVTSGTHVTCVCYGGMVQKLVEASKALEDSISMEIIDLRSVDYSSIDFGSIVTSVNKTHELLFFEEAPRSQGIGERILFNLITKGGITTHHRPQVICSMDIPMPVSKPLEAQAILSVEDIIRYFTEFWRRT
jgi:2-oxoisovalerate dehydrogenase E1 component